eukprot:364902-Chlamydomonas_euryale.AAC.6
MPFRAQGLAEGPATPAMNFKHSKQWGFEQHSEHCYKASATKHGPAPAQTTDGRAHGLHDPINFTLP